MKSLKKVIDKLKEVNDKTETIKNINNKGQNGQKVDSEEFYKSNIDLLDNTKNFLTKAKDHLTDLVEKQKKAVDIMEEESVGKNITDKNKIEENVKNVGNNINNMFEAVTPDGFAKFIAREILDLFKEISKKIEEFKEKTEEFGQKIAEKNINKKMANIKNFDVEKTRKNGILALDDKILNNIEEMTNLQNRLIKTGIIDKETASMFKNSQFEELENKIAKKAVPMAGVVSALTEFNKKTKEIFESIADYTKEKSQTLGVPGSQIIQNQLQDVDAEKAKKIGNIALNVVDKIPNPYAQAIAKGARMAQTTFQTQQKMQKEKKREI